MKDFHFCKQLKIISLVLVFALVLQVVPLGAFAVDTAANETVSATENSEPLRIAEVLYEDESRREETVKHFRMDDGTYAAVEYSVPVHYLDSNGEYLEIDNTLEAVTLPDGTSGYVNKDNNFSVTLPDDLSNSREIIISKNGKKVSFAVDGASNSKGAVLNNTADKKAQKLAQELQKATTEAEKTKIRNKYAYEVDKNESKLTYAYNGYIDVEYTLVGNKLKESLIINKQTGKADFKFKYDFDGMTAELQEDNSVLVKDGDEVVFTIEAPYMFDSAENYSSNITVEFKNKNKGFEYILHADKDWLKSSDRVYPVTIDPTIVATAQSDASKIKSGTGAKTGLDASDLAALAENGNTLKVGYVYGTNVSAVYFAPIPSSIPKSARITGATFNVICSNAPTSAFPVYLSHATSNWAKGTIALTGDDFPDVSSLEQTYIMSPTAETTYEFDITEIAQAWHCGEYANYGIVLHTDSAGTTQNFAAFYSNTASGKKPYYIYTYADTKGVEGYWSYSTVGLAKGGVASINQFTGYVSAEIPLLSTESQKLPFNLSLVYDGYSANTNTYSLSTCGLGMKLNIDQRIISLDTSSLEYANGYLYKYRDTDGTDIYLKRSTENSVSHDRDELGYGYDATIVGSDWKLLDRNDNYVMFSSAGCVKSIYSAEKKASVTVTYDPNNQYRIQKITDASGNNLTITRNDNWYVTKVADDFGRYVNFTYDSGNHLTNLTYYDGTVVNFTYKDDGMLSKVTGSDNTGVKFNYYNYDSSSRKYYLTNRISSVNEFYTASGTDTAGNSISFTYNSGNSTTITDTNGIKTTYVFDNWGRVTSAYNDHGSAYTDYQNPPSDTTKPATSRIHQLYKDVSLEKPVNNLLTNHSFEDGATNWQATSGATVVSTESYVGYKSLKIVGASGSYRRMLQDVTITEDGTYTLSAYVKITNAAATKVQLRIYEDGEVVEKTSIGYTNGSWQRVEVTAENLDASKGHQVTLVVDKTTCTAYFDAVQFEKADSANHYNLLENTTFKNNASSWDTTNTSSGSGTVTYTGTDATRPSFIKEGYKIVGHYNSNYAITQTVKINKPASTLALDLSAYSKANSVPKGLRENVLYSLCIKFVYEDDSGTKVGEELQFVTFNDNSSSWQNAAKPFIPSDTWRDSDYNVQYVCVYFQYYRNCNSAEISNVVLNFDSTGSIYDYDENGNLVSVRSLKDGKVYENAYNAYNEMTQSTSELDGTWEYDYCDNNNHLLETATHQELGYKVTYSYSSNLLTGTTFGSENTSKVITTSQSYSANNRHIASVTDAAGTTATYTYNADTDRLTKIVSGSAQTSYTYDGSSDRIKKVTSKMNSSQNATVTYGYDSAKRLSTITRGGNVYTITYDSWGNQKAVKVGSSTLSTNTYASGNGNLTKTTYGDGTYVNYVYDELDRLVSKKVNGTTQFTQVYNNSGAIGKYKDNVTGVTWTYNYDKIGRLRDIFGSNNNKYKIVYNSKNLISMKKYEVSGKARKVDYT
ncbi:MAG: DNRLRE domain-containing protein, partial [Clostridia bacterium]|nr:DNRLRE domain-containing protein [Clostridia bacterium]